MDLDRCRTTSVYIDGGLSLHRSTSISVADEVGLRVRLDCRLSRHYYPVYSTVLYSPICRCTYYFSFDFNRTVHEFLRNYRTIRSVLLGIIVVLLGSCRDAASCGDKYNFKTSVYANLNTIRIGQF